MAHNPTSNLPGWFHLGSSGHSAWNLRCIEEWETHHSLNASTRRAYQKRHITRQLEFHLPRWWSCGWDCFSRTCSAESISWARLNLARIIREACFNRVHFSLSVSSIFSCYSHLDQAALKSPWYLARHWVLLIERYLHGFFSCHPRRSITSCRLHQERCSTATNQGKQSLSSSALLIILWSIISRPLFRFPNSILTWTRELLSHGIMGGTRKHTHGRSFTSSIRRYNFSSQALITRWSIALIESREAKFFSLLGSLVFYTLHGHTNCPFSRMILQPLQWAG